MEFDITEAIGMIPRSIISLFLLFFITKLMGKKQVSQLSLFDYVVGISIGNFTAEMVINVDNQYINGIVAIMTFGILSYLVSIITLKSIIMRRLFTGVPTIIIEKGKINYKNLQKAKLDINDLLEQCRNMGYFDINEINYAILEVNGKISILPKSSFKNPTLQDLNIQINESCLSTNVIIDGNLMINNLKVTNKTEKWLKKELLKKGYSNYNNILLATITNEKLSVFEKEKFHSKNSLE